MNILKSLRRARGLSLAEHQTLPVSVKKVKKLLPLFLAALTTCYATTYASVQDKDDARVCLSIGLFAKISDLDDINMNVKDGMVSGAQNAIYKGQDTFHVLANGPVRIISTGDKLTHTQNNRALPTSYSLENQSPYIDTDLTRAHNAEHTVFVEAQTTQISASPAGHYTAQTVITVMPQLENILDSYQCSSNSSIYPIRSEYATLAFEDLYPRPGDADYNDMVVNFKIEEFFNKNDELTAIDLEFIPIARGAGYDHKLLLDLDGSVERSRNITTQTTPTFNGDATITATYENTVTGTSQTVSYEKDQDITIFSSTKSTLTTFANVNKNGTYTAPKQITKVRIELDDPSLNIRADRASPGTALYRPYLHVWNTRQDIDLYTSNSEDGMIDPNGYPFGLIVPYDWSWPLERANINQAYPYFTEYRNWLSEKSNTISNEALNWYLYPDPFYTYNYN